MSLHDAKVLTVEPLMIKDAKWTTLKLITYRDPLGRQRKWETAERRTRPRNSDVDAVGIVAVLAKDKGPEMLLQKQFRAPLDNVCIELPAGLVDEGETAKEAAIRELREETGYVGEVLEGDFGMTPVMFNDPGFCNTNLNMVHVHVDMSRPENRDPQPRLEEGEFIECFTVPLEGLYAECSKLSEEGYAIDARVATLAEGIELARRWKLW